MGCAAQNSSGVHWCKGRVRFNEVAEKVPTVPEKVWEALVQSQVRVPEKVPGSLGAKPWGSAGLRRRFRRRFRRRSGRLWCRARSGSTGFRRRFRRRSGRLWCRAGSGSTGFRRRFWRRCGRLWCRARLGSTGLRRRFQRRFRRRFREVLVQSQVRFNRVPEKVPEKVWEALVQSQVRFNRICGHLTHGNPAEVFPALGFAARFRKICKNKTLRCWGYHRSLCLFTSKIRFELEPLGTNFPSDQARCCTPSGQFHGKPGSTNGSWQNCWTHSGRGWSWKPPASRNFLESKPMLLLARRNLVYLCYEEMRTIISTPLKLYEFLQTPTRFRPTEIDDICWCW